MAVVHRRVREWCWGLDALSPVVLRQRVEQQIVRVIDRAAWERAGAVERLEQESLREVMENWRSSIPGLAQK